MFDSDAFAAVLDDSPSHLHSQAAAIQKRHQTSDTPVVKSVGKATTPEYPVFVQVRQV